MDRNVISKILFVGGDLRQIRAINYLTESGFDVCVFGIENCRGNISDRVKIIDDLSGIDEPCVVVLPLPYTTDGKTINAAENKQEIPDLIKNVSPDCVVFAGKCDKNLSKLCREQGARLVDYYERDDFQILNAVPTAEGAIQIAMEELPSTIHSSKCLILGGGRISKVLASMLRGLGAHVTVAARKKRDIAYAEAFGNSGILLSELYDCIGCFDIIFNTIPSLILDRDLLVKTKRDALIIDLASKPGGVDFEAARKMNIKVVWALSLPGKVAPDTAGKIIGTTIKNLMDELEVR